MCACVLVCLCVCVYITKICVHMERRDNLLVLVVTFETKAPTIQWNRGLIREKYGDMFKNLAKCAARSGAKL